MSNDLNLQMLLQAMMDRGASDLHLTVGTPPQLRIDGSLQPLRTRALTPEDTKALTLPLLSEAQRARFAKEHELDMSFGAKGLARFRLNLYFQRRSVGAAIRVIPFRIIPAQELNLPPALLEVAARPSGLVLITGPTGSGKSTTLASIIDLINTDRKGHIVTIEDPVEFVHSHKGCIVTQREVGSDTDSFAKALKHVLRQDPDVVLIGELRDLETMEAALSIAETGHLAFATLHTNGAIQTINRILDMFPPQQQKQVRAQLSFVLLAVMSQQLVKKNGGGRAMVSELLLPNPAIRNLMREDKLHQIYSQMQVGQTGHAMHTMNQSLLTLIQARKVNPEEAFDKSPDPEELRKLLARA